MCKGIKDLFLVIYRNHIHHIHHFCMKLEDFGYKLLRLFLVFAVMEIRIDFCYQVFVDSSYHLTFKPQFLHSLTN